MRIPTPPTMVNHRNSSRRCRGSAAGSPRRRRSSASRSCRRRRRRSCSSTAAVSSACAPATAGAGATGEELGNFEPGSDIAARVTILAEGTQGHLTGAALDRFGLRGDNPQVWALGVKEVWKVARPLDRGDAHDGVAAARREAVPRVRRVVHLSDGRGHGDDRHGRRARLPRRGALGARSAAGAEDASAGAGGSSTAASACSGARRRFRRAGFVALPTRFHAPGLLLCGDGVGLVNVPALKGIHYAVESGRLAAEAAWRTLARGASARAALASYDDVAARVVHLARPPRGAEHAPGVRARLLRRRRTRRRDDGVEGSVPSGRHVRRSATRSSRS